MVEQKAKDPVPLASSNRRGESGLTKSMRNEPYRFSFIQLVRLMQKVLLAENGNAPALGSDAHPADEYLRLSSLASRVFPPAEVVETIEIPNLSVPDGPKRTGLITTFMGIYGPSGALPYHDTQRIIDSIPRSGTLRGGNATAEKDLLDLFTHRILSLFYRASIKYRLPFHFENTYKTGKSDLFTQSLFSFAGIGLDGLQGRNSFQDELLIRFSGNYSRYPRCAVSLQNMLQDVFSVPVKVLQFVGQWRDLGEDGVSLMPSREMPLGQNCQLGISFIVGRRIWDIQGKFRIRLGPLGYRDFCKFIPGSKTLKILAQLSLTYTGPQFDFDLQPVLKGDEVPFCSLDGSIRLGQDSWLRGEDSCSDRDDTIVQLKGNPAVSSRWPFDTAA